MAAVTATGVPNPAPLEDAPNANAISSTEAPVLADPAIESCTIAKAAVLLGELVEEDDVQHDPADREQAGRPP